MATSAFHLPGAFHSRVYRNASTGEYFILKPDMKVKDCGPSDLEQLKVFQVHSHPRSDQRATYQVFTEGERREDLEVGLRIVGMPWGTHTIIEPGAQPDWADVEQFMRAFKGTGCIVLLAVVPLGGLLLAGVALISSVSL